jgi:hypothetical protein
MSKHDVITDNLIALTRARSFDKAVSGWTVKQLVALKDHKMQSCELCGTRFKRGAVIGHQRSGATILVGGTCLHTIQRRRFPERFNFSRARDFTYSTLRRWYEDRIDPGTWIKWIIEHAPKRYAQSAADLQSFGLVLNAKELDALIRFHDRTRLFPMSALLADAVQFEIALQKKIPAYLTIDQARKFRAQFGTVLADLQEAQFKEESVQQVVRRYISKRSDLGRVWEKLSPLERRAVIALVKLDEGAADNGTPLCADEVAANWPQPYGVPMIVWNPRIGLGFVYKEGKDEKKSHVWLWRSGHYRKGVYYDLTCWRGVTKCALTAVEQIEQLAAINDTQS